MQIVHTSEIAAMLSHQYGLDPTRYSPASREFQACAVRHATSRLCPCPRRSLVAAVVNSLAPMWHSEDPLKGAIKQTLEAVIGYGDLLELQLNDTDAPVARYQGPMLYLAPPTFIIRQSGSLLVLGVTPDAVHVLPELQSILYHRGHVRFTKVEQAQEALEILSALGYLERSENMWLKSPPLSTPEELIQIWDNRLNAAAPSGIMPDLVILNPDTPVRFYPERWSSPQNLTGRFVGRRPQRYGADLWCYVELKDGNPQRFIDMPYGAGPWRGCDEAWYLQAAIDSTQNAPLEASTAITDDGRILLRLYGPIPAWIQRRWDAIGVPVKASHCLLAYSFDPNEVDEEIAFLRQRLWTEIVAGY